MKTRCPYCYFRQTVPAEYKGTEVACVKCRQPFLACEGSSAIIHRQADPPAPSTLETGTDRPQVVTVARRTSQAVYRRRRLWVVATVILAIALPSAWWGYKRGKSKGFVEGGNTVIGIMKVASEAVRPKAPYTPPVTYYAPPPVSRPAKTFAITDAAFKWVSRDEYLWISSWQVTVESDSYRKVLLELKYYGEDDFVMSSELHFSMWLLTGQTVLTGLDYIDATRAQHVIDMQPIISASP